MADIFEKMFKDPLYDYIFIDNNICEYIIDSPYFQRLRRIEQTSMRCLYPSARHDRFIHSIGVYHLAKLAIAALKMNKPVYIGINESDSRFAFPDEETRESIFFSLEMAALLHDICHSPFSHTLECYFEFVCKIQASGEVLQEQLFTMFTDEAERINEETLEENNIQKFNSECKIAKAANHEIASSIFIFRYFKNIIQKIADERNEQLRKENKNSTKVIQIKPMYLFMARCILGAPYLDNVTDTDAVKNCIIKVLNSSIDVDKLDYITRDSSVSGFANTLVDTKRLLGSLVLAVYKSSENKEQVCLAFQKTAVGVIQNVVNSRNALYTWIYSHHKVVYESELIKNAVGRIAEQQTEGKEEFLTKYFSPESIEKKLVCDDTIWNLLLKYRDTIPEIQELISRNKRKKAIWKSFAEFQAYFNTDSRVNEIGHFSKKMMDKYFINSDKEKQDRFKSYLNQFQPAGEEPFEFDFILNKPKISYIGPNSTIVYLNNNLFSFESIFSDLYKKGEVPPFFYLYCKKEDKVRLSKDNYKLKKALIEYIKKFEGFRLVHE